MAKLFLFFLIVPLVEIYFLIEVGDVIGAGFTVFMVVLTALIGAALVRYQGFTTLARAQAEMLNSRMPALEVVEGALILLAGALLFIPGFVTDTLGFLLLIPPLRQVMVLRFLKKRVMRTPEARIYDAEARDADERIINIEYKDRD